MALGDTEARVGEEERLLRDLSPRAVGWRVWEQRGPQAPSPLAREGGKGEEGEVDWGGGSWKEVPLPFPP